MTYRVFSPFAAALALVASACVSNPPEGLARATPAETTVRMDMFHRPLPEIPLPNDIATRFDATSATGRRVNASMIAPTAMERRVRGLIDQLDGWGTLQPIGIPFTAPIDVQTVIDAHSDPYYDLADDVVYLVNIDRNSKSFGRLHHLDVGNGNYPVTLERMNLYWKNDPRENTITLGFEETDEDTNGNGVLDLGEDTNGNGVLDPGEDVNGNGVLDPPEDTDADGLLDKPNYRPGANPDPTDLAARADAMMTFYEKQTNTLLLRPLEPLDERTTYAVLVTRRIKDEKGNPVGSPYPFINHTAQTDALKPLLDVMPKGLSLDDVAFAFSFTTQSVQAHMKAVRDGLYGHGVQKHLGEQFPAVLNELMPMRDEGAKFPGLKQAHLVYAEQWKAVFQEVATSPVLGMKPDTEEFRAAYEGLDYIDYFVVGSYESPQLFERTDDEGDWLPFDDQSWPPDLDLKPAPARSETVYFTLSVPRKEISVRKDGKQAPITLLGHGYGSTRFEGMQMAGYFARHGVATLSIDAPGHGISLGDLERGLVTGIFKKHGMEGAAEALMSARAFNQDSDMLNSVDSGVDFWTAYLFHTRDVVRQYVLDWMQAVRIIRSFDGRKWVFDTKGDGEPTLAGDFDGDGIIDVGRESKLSVVGASLGGMLSMLIGSLEPAVSASVPIAGGGGFSDMGIRTTQSGAYEGFILRAMGPLYTGTIESFDGDGTGEMLIETVVPFMNKRTERRLAKVPGVRVWDTLVAENLVNGSRGCGYVLPNGRVRVNLESDLGDRTRLTVYAGPQLNGDTKCGLRDTAIPRKVIDTFELPGAFLGSPNDPPRDWELGEPLVALADGLGLRRAHPDLRRFQGLGQLVLDSADPASFARHMQREPLEYPGTGEKTRAHALVITSQGDLAVPANTGVTFCRAAGLVDYLEDDPRFGKPMNQVLIDHHVPEAVHTLKRYTSPRFPGGVHMDVENFSQGNDLWDVPRIDVPLHDFTKTDAIGGKSACIFPLAHPEGMHGFAYPGVERDKARKEAGCANACDPELDPENICSCQSRPFDTGYFMFNMIAGFVASDGQKLSDSLCLSSDDCEGKLLAPEARSGAQIDAP